MHHLCFVDNWLLDPISENWYFTLLLQQKPNTVPVPSESVMLMEYLLFTSISAARVRVWTDQGTVLAKIK